MNNHYLFIIRYTLMNNEQIPRHVTTLEAYELAVQCGNCEMVSTKMLIPKGMNLYSFPCPACGCVSSLHRYQPGINGGLLGSSVSGSLFPRPERV